MLAIHLQKLYERLKDYEPSVEYSQRLQQLSRAVATQGELSSAPVPGGSTIGTRGIWTSILDRKEKRDSLALTRVLTSHEAAMSLQSPKGLMLHGEVGTGKSMLVDLFADCLPNHKKRRWHFNTFMLDTFSRLEALRRSRSVASLTHEKLQDEYSLLWLARDLIETSPILFLDEFQLPDRTASKILSNLMTSFFQLGGVLIATSNRMPEELAKAAGMEFMRPVSRLSRLGWSLGLRGIGRDDGPGQQGEFAQFLEVLRARCEVWEMEGKRDYRRLSGEMDSANDDLRRAVPSGNTATTNIGTLGNKSSEEAIGTHTESAVTLTLDQIGLPKNYLIQPDNTTIDQVLLTLADNNVPIQWNPSTLTVYGRNLSISRQYNGIALFTFAELCGATLGPADYITIASTYHTLVLFDVPVLSFLQKNEARRLVTLLDALYEARCRLLITAAAGPDDVLFPERPAPTHPVQEEQDSALNDAVYPETYSEIHQDLTSPFRPNILSYSPNSSSLAPDALEDDPPNRVRRPDSSYTDERKAREAGIKGPDFANIGGLTGEDEVFAVKRAKSRMWEMCSARWWARSDLSESSALTSTDQSNEAGWWRPLPLELRHWERSASSSEEPATEASVPPNITSQTSNESVSQKIETQEHVFAHGASPFRTSSEPPPKFNWTHAWGTIKWGKKAGVWGVGVEGVEERKRAKQTQGLPTDQQRKKD
jgi:protein AFG1